MLIITNLILGFVALIFVLLWLKEKKHASEAEVVAYGLRAEDDNDDNTKTSISMMEAEYDDAIKKLTAMGEIHQNEWGEWLWTKSGKKLGENKGKTTQD